MLNKYSRTGFSRTGDYLSDNSSSSRLKRMLSWFSTAIYQESDGNVAKLLRTVIAFGEQMEAVEEQIQSAHLINAATGKSLERLGGLYGVVRQPGESDEVLRNLIQYVKIQRQSSGTVSDIKQYVADILKMSPDYVVIPERYASSPFATITVRLTGPPGTIVDWKRVDEIVMAAKAAGVFYRSPEYQITSEWVAKGNGWGYHNWDTNWPK